MNDRWVFPIVIALASMFASDVVFFAQHTEESAAIREIRRDLADAPRKCSDCLGAGRITVRERSFESSRDGCGLVTLTRESKESCALCEGSGIEGHGIARRTRDRDATGVTIRFAEPPTQRWTCTKQHKHVYNEGGTVCYGDHLSFGEGAVDAMPRIVTFGNGAVGSSK